jgi:hypothetical protein
MKELQPKTGPQVHDGWSGKNPPPDNAVTDWDSYAEAKRAAKNSVHIRVFFEYLPLAPSTPVWIREFRPKEKALEWLGKGAQRVLIDHPDHPKPLHGVLVLSSTIQESGKKSRVYALKLPEKLVNYVTERDGRVAMIADPFSTGVELKGTRFGKPGPGKATMTEEDFYKKVKVQCTNWILWISTVPFKSEK